jgi:hypothetical protein
MYFRPHTIGKKPSEIMGKTRAGKKNRLRYGKIKGTHRTPFKTTVFLIGIISQQQWR